MKKLKVNNLLNWILAIGLLIMGFITMCERNKRIDAELNSDHLLKENELIKERNENLIDSIKIIGIRIDSLHGESLRDYWADYKKRHNLP